MVSTNNGTQTDHVSTSDVPVGTWTYVSAVYDGVNLSFYINGALDGSAQAYTAPSVVADLPQYIGATDPDDPSTHFDGLIDQSYNFV